ncbi:MAG: helix-hairpin-helix domain-containing protein [Bacteroidota bacterium]
MADLLLFLMLSAGAQTDTLLFPTEQDVDTDLLEDFLQAQEAEGNFDFNTLYAQLATYREKPLNINKANFEDLSNLRLLSDSQILQLLNYRQRYGNLIALEELQAVPGFDLPTIRRVLPYITLNASIDDVQVPLGRMILTGDNEAFLRMERILELQRGFRPGSGEEADPPYFGDRNRVYFRYRHRFSNRLSYGLTAEKDAGEEFFQRSNTSGFDFYSAHFFLHNYTAKVKAIAIGDFQASFGQGLILYSGFGRSKGINVMNIKRNRRVLRPYSGVNENNFLRGAGATFQLNDQWAITAFGSSRSRDANVLQVDTLDQETQLQQFSSFLNSGFHRTSSEISGKDALRQNTLGLRTAFSKDGFQLSLNALVDRFDKTLERPLRPYNQFLFTGRELANASIDYSYILKNANLFGETAISSNGSIATTNGLLLSLDRNIDLSVLYRHFPFDYQALNANPLAETTGANNETGLYMGTVVRLNRHWQLQGYFDTWRHPWLRFRSSAPSRGYEYRARLTYYRKRKLTAFAEIRNEVKEQDSRDPELVLDVLVPVQLVQARLQVNHQLTPALELRSRVDWGFYDDGFSAARDRGFAIYQDAIFRSRSFPLSFTTRFALFDTDSFNMRFFAYENDLLYSFSVPAYYGRGHRFYLNLRYRGIRKLTFELRYARTQWNDREVISSGFNQIEGNVRSEVKVQVGYRF